MKNSKLILGCTLLMVMGLQASMAWAATAGYVQFVFGQVSLVKANGETSAVQKGTAIGEGDTISTALNASAQIRMQDGGFIAVRPDTRLKFDNFQLAVKAGEPESSYFSLIKGGFRAVTGAIGRVNKKDYRITTAAATIGIRGTDHETIYLPNDLPGAAAGAYSKVNVGETSLTTSKGTIYVSPNQMGFAGGMDQLPKLQPINTNIFTVSAAPAPSKLGKDGKAEDKQDAAQDKKGESVRATAAADDNKALAKNGEIEVATSLSNGVELPESGKLPVTASNGGLTLNTSNQTLSSGGGTVTLSPNVLTTAYVASRIAVGTSGVMNMNWGQLANSTDLVYAGGGLQSMTFHDIGGGAGWTFTSIITGGTATVTNAPAGIQLGMWTGYTGMQNTSTWQLGGKNNNSLSGDWMYAPLGYLDTSNAIASPFVGTGAGTFTYQLDGANAPFSKNSGLYGTVTSASISVNFLSMVLSGNMAITMPGSEMWGATITNQPLVVSNPASVFYAGATPGIAAGSTLSVSHGIGVATVCTTCGGNVNGTFTGQNFAGAMLAYQFWDNAPTVGGDVSGNVAFTRVGVVNNPVVTNGAPGTSNLWVIGTGNGALSTYPTATFNGTVLTGYSSGVAPNISSTIVTCPTCTATASGQVASTGIYYGNWTSGSITQSSSSSFPAGQMPPSYWITGPEAGPLYLPQALIGTATYNISSGLVSNGAGTAGTVSGTSALTLDFNKQTVGVNLDFSVASTAAVPHVWNVHTVPGSEAALRMGQGVGGGVFQASTFNNGGGSGLLAVTVDGGVTPVTINNANINGQLTGVGLTGAILSFNVNGTLNAAAESISGVAAFTGTAVNTATPHRYVLAAFYDPFAPLPQALVGFDANNASRVTADASGNLTTFDNQFLNTGGSSSSMTFTNNTALLKDFGSDSATGISWGRWEGGTFNVTNRQTGVVTPVTSTGSLHWIAEPVTSSATTLPISGTYNYTYAGGTKPTDNLGGIGNLSSATLAANFTAQTVNLGVAAIVSGTTLSATGTNVPIIQNTVFYASSQEPTTSTSHLTVSCSGTCGTLGGTVIGGFSGAGAIGATMTYGLQNGNSSISGVAAFHR